ncbi:MAG: kinase/pyrophosphorylase [Synergistales bacterium]|nr:kinase/pyrophosphorylase [Synergistales bacterium]
MALELFVVSDFTGETAEHVARAAASQFGAKKAELRRFRYVNNDERGREVLEEALRSQAVIICTLVDHALRRWFVEEAEKLNLPIVDILGPILKILENRLGCPPLETPGLLRRLDEEYFRRVKAVEFAIKCDDGRGAELYEEADLVILGVSRTSKTPLSMYLAHKGVMVANIPLVPEADPPKGLFDLPPERVIGLTINTEKLSSIRKERLRILGLDADLSNYAQPERLERELDFSVAIMRRVGCKIFDVTNRAIEEVAQEVLDYLRG